MMNGTKCIYSSSLSKILKSTVLGTFSILTNLYFTWAITCSLPYTFGGKIALHTPLYEFITLVLVTL